MKWLINCLMGVWCFLVFLISFRIWLMVLVFGFDSIFSVIRWFMLVVFVGILLFVVCFIGMDFLVRVFLLKLVNGESSLLLVGKCLFVVILIILLGRRLLIVIFFCLLLCRCVVVFGFSVIKVLMFWCVWLVV